MSSELQINVKENTDDKQQLNNDCSQSTKEQRKKKGSDKVHCVTSGDQVAYCHSNGLCHAKENKKKKKIESKET